MRISLKLAFSVCCLFSGISENSGAFMTTRTTKPTARTYYWATTSKRPSPNTSHRTTVHSTTIRTVGYSNVRIEYETYGRVYISGREVCYGGLTYQSGEALCHSKGYSYSSFSSVSPRSHYNTYIIQCSSTYISDCYIRDNSYCSRALYLNCQDNTRSSTVPLVATTSITTTPTKRTIKYWSTTQKSTKSPTTYYWAGTRGTVGYSDVQIEYGTYGRVIINGNEVCYEGLTYQSGEALCQSKGYSFSSFNSVSPRNYNYIMYGIQCSSTYIKDCNIQDHSPCSSVLYLSCFSSTISLTTTPKTPKTSSRYWTGRKKTVTTSPYWKTSAKPTGTVGTVAYSDVQIEYGTYGRVYVNGREVCYEGLTYQSGEAICESKGYNYSSSNSVSPRSSYNTYEFHCSSSNVYDCYTRDRYYCSSVLYIYCYGSTTNFKTTTTTPSSFLTSRKPTSTVTTSRYWKTSLVPKGTVGTVAYSDVQIEYGTYGRVYVNGREVCYEGLTYQSGEALCQSKGYSHSSSNSVSSRNYYNTYEFHCSSSNIYGCYTRDRNYCSSVLYIYCYETTSKSIWTTKKTTTKVTTPYYWETTKGQTGIRLVGSGYPWKGTIEIRHNGQWGTICDDGFDKRDGDVICRMLGYTHSSQTYQNAHYGQGSGPIWLDDLGCHGYESDVTYCSSGGWGSHNCGHSEDAGVDCENSATKEYDTTTYDSCNGYQCYNGGTCIFQNNGYPGYYCVCPNGYTGTNCYYETTTYDPCYGYPCRHGGTCYRNYGYPGYYCACANGYTGQDCDVSVGFSPENAISVGCMDNTWDISVYLPPFYNRYPDFDPSDLYLGTDSCTGYVNGNYLHFRSGYSACGTVTKTLTDNIVHTNQLIYALHDPNHHYIVHEYRFRVPVDCYMTRNEGGSGHFNHGHDITIPAAHHVTGSSHHSVRLQFYTDSTFRYTKPLYGSRAGDTVYVRAYTDVRDYNLKMRISDCFTTPTSSSFSSLKYFIIQNGCVIDPNARILSQTTHETRFYFQDFEYSTNRDSLYLHCNATFCKSNDYSDACEQTCHHARKRVGGGNIVYGGPVDSMAVNEAVRLTKADDTRSLNSRGNSNMIAVLSVILGIILITLVTFMVIGKVKKNRQKKSQIV